MSDVVERMAGLSSKKRELLLRQLNKNRPAKTNLQTIPRVSRDSNSFPASFAQLRLWFFDQWDPTSCLYNIPASVSLNGSLDMAALEESLREILRRHEALRTTFVEVDGQPNQVVASEPNFTLPLTDLSALTEDEGKARVTQLAIEEATRPFNLAEGPLLRASLIKLADNEHVLLLNMHHIVSDGWSVGVFVRELGSLYDSYSRGESPSLPELPLQYVDFAAWQRQWLSGDVLEEQLSYWRDQLGGPLPTLQLLDDRPRPTAQTFQGKVYPFQIPQSSADALKELSRQEGTTLFMTALAVFKTLLYRYSGQVDVIVGTPIANRRRAELEGLIGFFTNTLVLRTEVSGERSFRETLRRVKEVCLGAYGHQDVPFEKLVEALQPERDLSRSPFFQVMFVLQNTPASQLKLRDLKLSVSEIDNGTAKFDLLLVVMEGEQGLDAIFQYNEDLFDAETIAQLATHYVSMVSACVATPDIPLSQLPLLAPEERHQIVSEWNDTTTSYGPFESVATFFEQQVELTPDAPALQLGERQLSYFEVNERANQLAHQLRRLGVGPEVCVGISLTRSIEMVVAVLGVLKAGGVYVPIDPSYPSERQAYMLADSAMPVLLTTQALAATLPPHTAHTLYADEEWASVADESTENLESTVAGGNLAYVLYTSGSTGRPKGVAWSHEALTNLVEWVDRDAGMAHGVRTLQYASLSFDVSAQELFPTWRSGGTVVLLEEEQRRDAEQLLKVLAAQRAERLFIPFVALQHLAEVSELHLGQEGSHKSNGSGATAADEGSRLHLREVVTAGEQLRSTPQLRRFFERMPGCRLFNFYGPTEGNIVTTYELQGEPESWPALPSIGRPIANTRVHVLDAQQEPVPVGVAGELYIGGVVLARGYLGRAELTGEKFVPDPLGLEAGGRLYRTGDLARYRRDGELEFLGRGDDQVKVRGYRVELGEVETVLGQHPRVQEAVVVARDESGGGKRLVAYVVSKAGEETGAENGEAEQGVKSSELRAYLKERLPEYMVPGVYVQLEEMPLSPNRKIDRKALPAPEETEVEREREFVAPRSPEEEALSEIWAEVLGVERVGVFDNFFELGGHSLLATQVISRAKKKFDSTLALRSIFEEPTVAGLTSVIMRSQEHQKVEAITKANRGDSEENLNLLANLNQLSEADVDALLGDLLAKGKAANDG